MKNKTIKIISLGVVLSTLFSISVACGGNSSANSSESLTDSSISIESSSEETSTSEEEDFNFVPKDENYIDGLLYVREHEEYFNFYGRNMLVNDSGNKMCLPNTASAFEFAFYGTECYAFLKSEHSGMTAYSVVTVTVDGVTQSRRIDVKNTVYESVALVSGLDEGWHVVKVEKSTQDLQNHLYLDRVNCDGKFAIPPEKSERKIEVYGDSITCGHSNLISGPEQLTSTSEDGMQTYATLAAKALEAQVNVVSRSGIVLGNYKNNACMYKSYKNVSCSMDTEWDFSAYTPDVVVIFLGSNDEWYIPQNSPSASWAIFETQYKSIIQQLSTAYGEDTSFILCCGLWYSSQAEILEPMFARMIEDLPTIDIDYVRFADKTSIIHPSVKDHQSASQILIEKIKEMKGW